VKHVCLFDIDGTLVTTGGAGKHALLETLAREFALAETIDSTPMSGRTDRSITADLFRLHQVAESDENWTRFQATYLKQLPQSLAALVGRVLPGIEPLLQSLVARGDVALGLLTGNMHEGARIKLSHYRLWNYFQFGAYGDVHFDRDDIAREAIRVVQSQVAADFAPDRIWVVGDTPFDVRCARAIGARAIAVSTGTHTLDELRPSEPDLLVDDLTDAAPFLALLDA
jgi:phosphoglycolate phosphatase-like HAD superfamily hydrolase